MEDITQYVCKNPNCKFPEDGVCIEDLPAPAKCPFRKLASEATDEPVDSTDPTLPIVDDVPIHLGEAMTEEECDLLMAAIPVKFVMLAGLRKSGKTTSLAALFQLFQENYSFANTAFAGSSTLIGFEKICHPSRIDSDLDEEQTIRTPKGQKGYLHLKLMENNDERKKVDFLFTDISGEDYKDLSKSTDFCKKFVIAKRVDHFVLFMDCGRLANFATRQEVRTNSTSVLMSLLEANMIDKDATIDVVFSRYDLLTSNSDADRHHEFINLIKTDLTSRLSTYGYQPHFFELASRPTHDEKLPFGHGLDKLLIHWIKSNNSTKLNSGNFAPTGQQLRQATKFRVN